MRCIVEGTSLFVWSITDRTFSVLVERAASEGWEGTPGRPPARGTEEEMEPDDLLCSRNARSQKTLVEHAQWDPPSPPSRGKVEERCSFDSRSGWTKLVDLSADTGF